MVWRDRTYWWGMVFLGCGPTQLGAETPFDSSVEYAGEFEGSWWDLEPDEPRGVCSVSLVCDEDIPDEPKIMCEVTIEDEWGELIYDDWSGVERRGRSSYWAPKPQYSIELRDAFGTEQSASLMGMSNDSDWVLNGRYFDRSLFRNSLGYDLFRGMGFQDRWAPASAWCDLSLNGEEQGLYGLTERIKRGDGRIAIASDDGQGRSFVLKLDDIDGFYPNRLGYGEWKLVYPKAEGVTGDQLDGMIDYIDGWYAALESKSRVADDVGVWAYVDVNSLVDFVIVQELMRNTDAYYLSVHVWKDRGGRLHFVPWDLDLSLGQPNYNDNESPEGWLVYRPDWMARMVSDPIFVSRLAERWRELREDGLSDASISDRIDRYLSSFESEVDANFEIWPIDSIQFSDGALYEVSSHEEEVARIRAFISARTAWMDAFIDTY